MSTNAVVLHCVSASYGHGLALENVELAVPIGGVTAVLGANGAGKTTALKIMAGIMRPSAGKLLDEFGNEVSARVGLIRPGVSMSPEGRRLFAQMTVEENLLTGTHGIRGARSTADKLAEVFDLFPRVAERRRQLAGTLSGGEQQMVAIGRALMREPKLMLLDEPTLGLSPRMASVVAEMIAQISTRDLTIVLVEQDANIALNLATQAYVLVNGRVRTSGPAREFDAEKILSSYFDSDIERGKQIESRQLH